MRLKVILSVLLNLTAVATPAAVLFRSYGPTAMVDPNSTRDVLMLLGGAVFAFSVALVSSVLLKGSDRPALIGVLEQIFEGRKPRRQPD